LRVISETKRGRQVQRIFTVNVRELIDNLQPKLPGILNMLGKVLAEVSVMQRLSRSHLWSATMHFQGSSGCDDYDCIRNKTADSALDVAKLLHAHVGTKAASGQYIA